MEMNYFKKTGKMMVAACMLAGLPFIPGTVSASELQTQMMSVQMESTTLKELFGRGDFDDGAEKSAC